MNVTKNLRCKPVASPSPFKQQRKSHSHQRPNVPSTLLPFHHSQHPHSTQQRRILFWTSKPPSAEPKLPAQSTSPTSKLSRPSRQATHLVTSTQIPQHHSSNSPSHDDPNHPNNTDHDICNPNNHSIDNRDHHVIIHSREGNQPFTRAHANFIDSLQHSIRSNLNTNNNLIDSLQQSLRTTPNLINHHVETANHFINKSSQTLTSSLESLNHTLAQSSRVTQQHLHNTLSHVPISSDQVHNTVTKVVSKAAHLSSAVGDQIVQITESINTSLVEPVKGTINATIKSTNLNVNLSSMNLNERVNPTTLYNTVTTTSDQIGESIQSIFTSTTPKPTPGGGKIITEADTALVGAVQSVIGRLFPPQQSGTQSESGNSPLTSIKQAPSSSNPQLSSTDLSSPTDSADPQSSSMRLELSHIADPELRKLLKKEFTQFEATLINSVGKELPPSMQLPRTLQLPHNDFPHLPSFAASVLPDFQPPKQRVKHTSHGHDQDPFIPEQLRLEPETQQEQTLQTQTPVYHNLTRFSDPSSDFGPIEHVVVEDKLAATPQEIQLAEARRNHLYSALTNLKTNVSALLAAHSVKKAGSTNPRVVGRSAEGVEELGNEPGAEKKGISKNELARLQSLLTQTIDGIEHIFKETAAFPKAAAQRISSTTRVVTDTVASTTNVVVGGIKQTIYAIPSTTTHAVNSTVQLFNIIANTSLLRSHLRNIVPSILSRTTTLLPAATIQAAIYTALMLFHRHDKFHSSLNLPSLISQNLASNLQTLTALGPVLHQHAMVNYYNLFRSEPWVGKSTCIFLQRYLYLALSSYARDERVAFEIAQKSGLDVALVYNSSPNITVTKTATANTVTTTTTTTTATASATKTSKTIDSTASTPNSTSPETNSTTTEKTTQIIFGVEVPFLLYEDRTNGNIVVSIRGTNNLDDVITDLVSWPRQVGDSYVHSGMFSVAQKLLPNILFSIRNMLIQKYLDAGIVSRADLGIDSGQSDEGDENADTANGKVDHLTPEQLARATISFKDKPIPRIVFSGHSLGGGLAGLLALITRELKDKQNYNYFSKLLKEHTKDKQPVDLTLKTTDTDLVDDGDEFEVHPASLLGNHFDFVNHHYPTNDPFNNNLELALRLNPEAIIFASPALVSPQLSDKMRGYTITVVSGEDPVPRLSEYSINNSIFECIHNALVRDPAAIVDQQDKDNDPDKSHHPNSTGQTADKLDKSNEKGDKSETKQKTAEKPATTGSRLSKPPPIAFSYPTATDHPVVHDVPHSPLYHTPATAESPQAADLCFYVDHTGEFVEHSDLKPVSNDPTAQVPLVSTYINPFSGLPITSASKPVPLHPDTSSPYIPSLGTVVDMSLRFHRMTNPALFVKNEIKRSLVNYGKSKVVDTSKEFAKTIIRGQLGKFGENTVQRSVQLRKASKSRLQARTKQAKAHFQHFQEGLHHILEGDVEIPAWLQPIDPVDQHHEHPSQMDQHNNYDHHLAHVYQRTREESSQPAQFPYRHWNSALHPLYMIKSAYEFHSHHGDSTQVEPSILDQTPERTEQFNQSFLAAPNNNNNTAIPPELPRSHALPTSLDQLASEFNFFFHKYKSTIQNNISPALFDALANLPITPKQPSKVIKQSPTVTAPKPTSGHKATTQTTQTAQQPPPSSQSFQSSQSTSEPVVEEQLNEDVDASTPLDAILPIPMTSAAFEAAKSYIIPDKVTREDTFYSLQTKSYGIHPLDEFHNAICRMDVPGNVLYIKRLHKEVYLSAHLPVVEYDDKDAETANGPVLTTIASKVLSSYDDFLLKTNAQPQEMASFNNTDTWHINQTTGLLNVDTQTINEYRLQPEESLRPSISTQCLANTAVDPTAKQLPSELAERDNRISFNNGFKHPSMLFNFHHPTSTLKPPFIFQDQGTELISALLNARDSPALPNITGLSITSNANANANATTVPLPHPGVQSKSATETPTSTANQSEMNQQSAEQTSSHKIKYANHILALHLPESTQTIRQRTNLIISIIDNLTQAIASGGDSLLTLHTLQTLASYSTIQQQLEQFKKIKSQEYVRLFCARPQSNQEFSNLSLTEHSLFDHFSRSYVGAFEDALGDDSITISPQYSTTARSKENYTKAVQPPTQPSASSTHASPTGLKLNPTFIHIDHSSSLRSLLASLSPDNTHQIDKLRELQHVYHKANAIPPPSAPSSDPTMSV